MSLLEYIRHFPSVAQLTSPHNNVSPSTFSAAYEKWGEVYSKMALIFQSQEKPFIGAAFRYVGTSLVHLAIAADSTAQNSSQSKVTDAVARISRSTGIAAIDRTPLPGQMTKRSQVLWLANLSFRCYFKLKNIRLCETVLGSVDNALSLNRTHASVEQKTAFPSTAALGMACYSRGDQVTYRYYLGRLRLSRHRIRSAYNELRWAFDNCTNAHMHNKTLILTHLIVSAIILGIYPTRKLLDATNLAGPFGGLVERARQGDGKGMYTELETWRDWHRQKGHYFLLREKLEIGVWRNLMRRRYVRSERVCFTCLPTGVFSFLIARLTSGLGAPTAPNTSAGPARTPPPTLKLANFLIMARFAWQDASLTVDDVECVTASLIDQGYIKAYAMHSSGNVVFRRTPDFGFEKMSTVY